MPPRAMTLTILKRPLIVLPISGSGSPLGLGIEPPTWEPVETGPLWSARAALVPPVRLSGIASSLVAEGTTEGRLALLYQNCRRAMFQVSIGMGRIDFW